MITLPKNITLLGIVAVAFVAADGYLIHSSARTTSGKYPLQFGATLHDFGEVNWDKTPQYDFKFTNVSNRDVQVANLLESCSCIAASVSKEIIKPKETGVVRLRLKPFGYNGDTNQVLSLWLQGYKQPTELRVHAQVNPLLMPTPTQIDLGNVDVASTVRSTLLLRNTTHRSVRVTRVDSSARWLKAEPSSNGVSANGDPSFTVQLVSPPSGPLHELLTIHTDVPQRSPIQIPVQAVVTSKWRRSAPELFFGFVNIDDHPRTTVVIDGLTAPLVRRVWAEGTSAHVSLSFRSHPLQAVLTTSLDPRHVKPGEMAGSVFIETNDPSERLVRIPITGVVQDPHSSLCCAPKETKP
jgi:hypothetical protein